MTHIEPVYLMLVFTAVTAALIIMANQIPTPAWRGYFSVQVTKTEDGGYIFSVYPSYEQQLIISKRHGITEIKGVHLKQSGNYQSMGRLKQHAVKGSEKSFTKEEFIGMTEVKFGENTATLQDVRNAQLTEIAAAQMASIDPTKSASLNIRHNGGCLQVGIAIPASPLGLNAGMVNQTGNIGMLPQRG